MKEANVETRLANIEEILKLLLINSVLGSCDIYKVQESIIGQFRESLSELGIYNVRINYIEEKYYLFAEMDGDYTLKDIKKYYDQACGLLGDIKLILVFEKLHGKRKKAFIDACISYYEKNGEMRVF